MALRITERSRSAHAGERPGSSCRCRRTGTSRPRLTVPETTGSRSGRDTCRPAGKEARRVLLLVSSNPRRAGPALHQAAHDFIEQMDYGTPSGSWRHGRAALALSRL
ncbi:hypothetical protein VTK56DRAFT_9349 [Thermocarpiscus australiensis]